MKSTTLIVSIALMAISAAAIAGPGGADTLPTDGYIDPRIKMINYNAEDVTTLQGHYGYTTLVLFQEYEDIELVSLGDTIAWKVMDRENKLFIKPVYHDADTNMIVTTRTTGGEERVYNFALEAKKTANHKSPELGFTLKIRHPQDELLAIERKREQGAYIDAQYAVGSADYSVDPKNINMEYSYKGATEVAPRRVFDDGRFTYFEFSDSTTVPAIFEVFPETKEEALLNYHSEGNYVVVERIAKQFIIRHGDYVTCIFNDRLLMSPKPNLDMVER